MLCYVLFFFLFCFLFFTRSRGSEALSQGTSAGHLVTAVHNIKKKLASPGGASRTTSGDASERKLGASCGSPGGASGTTSGETAFLNA